MFLKEIYMKNFKSFGHEKTVPFRPGVTAITGPNGSGKSNIGDAILFVLGPKSSKAIRAGKLSHLIFNGGKAGKPASYCKVSLIFDNKDRMLPVDDDEVKLTRAIKLSKNDREKYYSYFYINDRSSQLNEFEKILSHARISANGYNLVQQGDINQITSMSNVDRRKILDGLAGISIFDKDIDKANLDKEETMNNLQNVDILLADLENQLARLKRDRDNAVKYQELKKNHDHNEARLMKRRILNLDARIIDLREKIALYKEKIEELRKRIRKNMDEKSLAEIKLREIEQTLIDKGGEEAEQLREQIDALTVNIARTEEAIRYSREEREKLGESIKTSKEEAKKLHKEIKDIQKEAKTTSEEFKERSASLKSINKNIEAIRNRITSTNSKTVDIQREIILLKRKYDEKNKQFHDEKLELDRTIEKRRIKQNELENFRETADGVEFDLKDTEWQLSDLRKQTKDSSHQKGELDRDLYRQLNEEKKMVKQIQDLEHNLRTRHMEYSKRKTESEAAEHMMNGYKVPVNMMLSARDSGDITGIVGTVAELSTVNEDHKTAITVAASGKLEAIIVDDDSVAAKGIQHLKRRKAGRATFLPLNKMMPARTRGRALMLVNNPGVIGLAIDLIDYDERYKNAFSYVFRDTVIVKDLETAREYMGGVRLVTLDGELIDPSGAMTGGTFKPRNLTFGASKGEADRLFNEIQEMEAKHQSLSAKLSLIRGDIEDIQKKLGSYSGDRTGDIAKLETERNKYQSRLKALRNTIAEAEKEIAGMSSAIQESTGKVEGMSRELRKMEEKVHQLNEILLRAADKSLADSLNSLEEDRSRNDSIVQQLSAKLQVFDQQIRMINERVTSIEKEIKDSRETIEGNKDNEKGLKTELNDYREQKETLIKVQLSMSKELDGIRKERDAVHDTMKDKENKIENDKIQFSSHNELLDDALIKLPEEEDELLILREEFASLGIEVDEVDLPREDELRKIVKVLGDSMRRLEPVNMLAIEDYEKLTEKKIEKVENRKRLVDQKEELEKVVNQLTEKKKRALDEIFGEVNKNFMEIYSILSNGGNAQLILENPENPFEAGLMISARPRGKKVLYLNALSGGEKSLTAIAFIFAIQRYMPSPFYYLDEVDMFLDAPNAGNVAAMLRANSKYAQIIIVSLRKVTLNCSDTLYGVTMHGRGLSDVIRDLPKESLKYIAGDDLQDDDIDTNNAQVNADADPDNRGKMKGTEVSGMDGVGNSTQSQVTAGEEG